MVIKFNKPTVYMSHSVRGDEELTIEQNCNRAMRVAAKIRNVFPEIGIYCPADHDLCIQVLWKSGQLTEKQVLDADCEILRSCQGWFWWWTSASKGCGIEGCTAREVGLTEFQNNILTQDLLKANYGEVRRILSPIVEEAKKCYQRSK